MEEESRTLLHLKDLRSRLRKSKFRDSLMNLKKIVELTEKIDALEEKINNENLNNKEN